jgi:hypothetical protein
MVKKTLETAYLKFLLYFDTGGTTGNGFIVSPPVGKSPLLVKVLLLSSASLNGSSGLDSASPSANRFLHGSQRVQRLPAFLLLHALGKKKSFMDVRHPAVVPKTTKIKMPGVTPGRNR